MKFLSWLGTILIILVIIAAITAPGEQKFKDFINNEKDGSSMSCKPIINKSTQVKVLVKIATVNYVSYCESSTPLTVKDQNGELKPTNLSIPKITHSETYLGLFGKFWKL